MKPKEKSRKKPLVAPPESHRPVVPSPLGPVQATDRGATRNNVQEKRSDLSKVTSVTEAHAMTMKQESQDRRRLAIFLIVGGLLLAVVAFSVGEHHGRSQNQDLSSISAQDKSVQDLMTSRRPLTFEERVRQHRNQVGDTLNRQRIRAQYDNLGLPNPQDGSVPYRPDAVMSGLPLDGEKNTYSSMVPSPSRPRQSAELDVQNRVQLAKDLDEWEVAAREEYIRQFKANARAQGFEVKIDSDYNVEWQPIDRGPQSLSTGEAVH